MSQTVRGCVIDSSTGKPLTTAEVRLHHIGVLGEDLTMLDNHGCFLFAGMSEGEYSLSFSHSEYVPHYKKITLVEGETIDPLHIALRPGGFLCGKILDEKQQSPLHCHYTLIRAGESRGKSGYISDSGDHAVSDDGTFCSPPLGPERYFLRFAGILRKAPGAEPLWPAHLVVQNRGFDFLYPDAQEVSDAMGFDLAAGKTISGLQIQIPIMVWHAVHGKVTGDLPADLGRINVMFWRSMGIVDGAGGTGTIIEQDGTFAIQALPGSYLVEVCEFAPQEPDGRTHVVRRLAAASIRVPTAGLGGFEIHIPIGAAE